MKTSKKHFDIFKAECEKWVDRLGLSGWEKYYCLDESLDTYASTVISPTCKNVTFMLTTDWDDSIYPLTEEHIRDTAKHEVMHLLTGKLTGLARHRYVMEREIEEADEELVIKLAHFIV